MKSLRFLLFAALAALALPCSAQNYFEVEPSFGGGPSSNIRPAPAYVDARVLAANVAETHTVPAGVKWVLFSGTCSFYAKTGSSAAVPAADVTDGSASELNPAAWRIIGVTQISLIAPTSCVITLAFYK